jgi:hypothetical protein
MICHMLILLLIPHLGQIAPKQKVAASLGHQLAQKI